MLDNRCYSCGEHFVEINASCSNKLFRCKAREEDERKILLHRDSLRSLVQTAPCQDMLSYAMSIVYGCVGGVNKPAAVCFAHSLDQG